MRYRNVDLTFDNYKHHLKEFSLDIQDEVRSAILDNTPIGDFIDSCREDPFRLQQVRLAIKESQPEWLVGLKTGKSIYLSRKTRARGVNLTGVPRAIRGSTEKQVEHYLSWVEEAYVIPEGFDVSKVPERLLEVAGRALAQGIDPRRIFELSDYDSDAASYYVDIESVGFDTSVFKGKNPRNDALEAIVTIAGRPYSSIVVDMVVETTTGEDVLILTQLAQMGFDFEELGKPGRYETHQLNWVLFAYKRKLDYKQMLKPKLTEKELKSIFTGLEAKKFKRLSGRL